MPAANRIVAKIKRRIARGMIEALSVRGRPRPDGAPDASMLVPFDYEVDPGFDGRIAVICHLFHEEMADELKQLMANIPRPVDVYISTDTAEKSAIIERAFSTWSGGRVDVRLCDNRGRDIAPKLTTFTDVYDGYDLILYLHSKRSLTSTIGRQWFESLTQSLVGSPATVASILAVFATDPSIGIVMAQHFAPIRHLISWDGNYRLARGLAKRMGIALSPRLVLDMPSGSMFWFRPAALKPLLDLRLQPNDFPAELGQVSGTLQHAIERLILYVTESAGYGWVKVSSDASADAAAPSVSIASPADLPAFIARYRFDLLNAAQG
ncbi:hypothetical protein GCM10011380_09090 [Sphingomonas metalli]|uniref:Uncharacterized protein n=1 Tax=Sphingomonas metalli TaxID=1779358 RepID=A0A916SY35_9SPHN|nr:rhamnan synthesis F family protein [Sphingomonas metalli]GGB21682.1 hypothetical protein GCM10011380_09090 [Sphingomonas metalli]